MDRVQRRADVKTRLEGSVRDEAGRKDRRMRNRTRGSAVGVTLGVAHPPVLDEPKAVQRMRALTDRFGDSSRRAILLRRALEGAISLLGAGFGSIQISRLDGTSRIAADYGFQLRVPGAFRDGR
jgi:hypothetical protein